MAAPMASNSTGTGSPAAPPGFVREVKTTSVFVGSIAPGIKDGTLYDLLNVSGNPSIRRLRDSRVELTLPGARRVDHCMS